MNWIGSIRTQRNRNLHNFIRKEYFWCSSDCIVKRVFMNTCVFFFFTECPFMRTYLSMDFWVNAHSIPYFSIELTSLASLAIHIFDLLHFFLLFFSFIYLPYTKSFLRSFVFVCVCVIYFALIIIGRNQYSTHRVCSNFGFAFKCYWNCVHAFFSPQNYLLLSSNWTAYEDEHAINAHRFIHYSKFFCWNSKCWMCYGKIGMASRME